MDLVKFFYELGQLKRLKRTGWINAGIANPESIADHSFRAAIIGWILSDMEGADSEKVTKMLLMHDIFEARIGDVTIVNRMYVTKDEEKALNDQCKALPENIAGEFKELYKEFEECTTPESKVAKDADKLDMYLQAREHEDIGYSEKIAKEWKDDAYSKFQTESAKKIAKESENTPYSSWWDFIY